MKDRAARFRAVPDCLILVGFFLIAESLTFTSIASRLQGYHFDIFSFAFVFGGGLIVTMIGIFEARGLNPEPEAGRFLRTLAIWGLLGIVLGIAGGYLAISFSGLVKP